MKRRVQERGYALLAALVITALAALLAASAVAAALGTHHVGAADRSGERAGTAAWQGLDEQAERLRWQPWLADPPLTADAWRAARVQAQGTARGSRSDLEAVLELQLPSWCAGLVVSGDLQLEAPLSEQNSGGCVGGCVRGRQWATVVGQELVHADLWQELAVHALGSIWAEGAEIHGDTDGGVAEPDYVADTDMHTAADGSDLADITAAPDASLLAALRDGAAAPGDALREGILDVAQLPATPPGAVDPDESVLSAGYVVFVPAGLAPVRLIGERATDACPLVLVVAGDATFGEPGSLLSFRGAVVVVGRVDIAGVTSVEGSLYARSLASEAPLTVITAPDWRAHPLAGLATPVIVQLAST